MPTDDQQDYFIVERFERVQVGAHVERKPVLRKVTAEEYTHYAQTGEPPAQPWWRRLGFLR